MATKSSLKSKKEEISKATYIDIRRRRCPLMKALIEELYEDGNILGGDYLDMLRTKNDALLMDPFYKEEPLTNWKKILWNIFHFLKGSLEMLVDQHDEENCVKIFINLSNGILKDNPPITLYWVLNETYRMLFTLIVEKQFETKPDLLTRANAYYFYGKFLYEYENDFAKCLEYFDKALQLCKDHKDWKLIDGSDEKLLRRIANIYCDALLKETRKHFKTNINLAQEYTEKAKYMFLLGQPNKDIYIQIELLRADVLIYWRKNEDAQRLLTKLRSYAEYSKEMKLVAEVLLKQGIVFYNMGRYESSSSRLNEALDKLATSRSENLIALTLLYMGKLNALYPQTHRVAMNLFKESYKIFENLQDHDNALKAKYSSSMLKGNIVFPKLFSLLEEGTFEAKMKLAGWSEFGDPFWLDDSYYHFKGEDEDSFVMNEEDTSDENDVIDSPSDWFIKEPVILAKIQSSKMGTTKSSHESKE